MRTALATASLLLSTIGPGAMAQAEPSWRPHVLIVDSLDDVPPWMSQAASQRGADAGRLRDVPTGLRVHFPIVVTNLPSLEGRGMHFESDIELLGPKGQVLMTQKACCRKIIRGGAAGQVALLEPAAMVQFEPNDTPGTYSIRATVNDGQRTATIVESFRFASTKGDAGAAPQGLRLNQGEPPKKNPGVDRDVRDCLTLPTPNEVIKCTER